MDLRRLETFVKIAELKSFTKAAQELYLTQPTVSKQVVDLERYFGVRLIDRTREMWHLQGPEKSWPDMAKISWHCEKR